MRGLKWFAWAAAALLLGGCSLFPAEAEREPPPLVRPERAVRGVYVVERGPIVDEVVLRARVAPARQERLYFLHPGRLKALQVQSGDPVTSGQLLAELETGELSYEIRQAELRLRQARVLLEQAEHDSQFRGGPSPADVELRQLEVEMAGLALERLRRQQAEAQLAAPFAGVVTAIEVRPGDAVDAFVPILTVADFSDLVIEGDADADQVRRLALGQTAELEFADLGPLTGTVVQVPDPALRSQAGGAGQPLRVVVQTAAPLTGARAGMAGRVHIILDRREDAVLVPNSTLREYGTRTYVLVETPEGARREADVVVGIRGQTHSEIREGLAVGDRVITR